MRICKFVVCLGLEMWLRTVCLKWSNSAHVVEAVVKTCVAMQFFLFADGAFSHCVFTPIKSGCFGSSSRSWDITTV